MSVVPTHNMYKNTSSFFVQKEEKNWKQNKKGTTQNICQIVA